MKMELENSKIECPVCNNRVQVEDDSINLIVRCNKCQFDKFTWDSYTVKDLGDEDKEIYFLDYNKKDVHLHIQEKENAKKIVRS